MSMPVGIKRLGYVPKAFETVFYRLSSHVVDVYVAGDLSGSPPVVDVYNGDQPLLDNANQQVRLQAGTGITVSTVPHTQVPTWRDGMATGTWTRARIAPTVAQMDAMVGKKGLWADVAFPAGGGKFFYPCQFRPLMVRDNREA